MKKFIPLCLMLAFSIAGFTQQKPKLPIEGAWKLVGFTSKSGDTIRNWTNTEMGDQIKMWTGNHFSFTGIYKPDNSDLYGCGTYILKGNDYTEKIVFHNVKTLINTEYRAILEIRNDTLYQTSPMTDAAGKEMKNSSTTEKYVKLE